MYPALRGIAKKIYHKSGIRTVHEDFNFSILMDEWRLLQAKPANPWKLDNSIMLLSAAPHVFSTSKGDAAMMESLSGAIHKRDEKTKIFVSTSTEFADERARSLGYFPVRIFDQKTLKGAFAKIEEIGPSHVLTIGADVMDGSYSPTFSLRMAALADLSARAGAKGGIMGFSFSKKSYSRIGSAFDMLDPKVHVNLRDPVSLVRFSQASKKRHRLVADMAFLVSPNGENNEVIGHVEWINQHQSAGGRVIGFNIHPTILPIAQHEQLPKYIAAATRVLQRLLEHDKKLSLILIPHDSGGHAADTRLLEPIMRELAKVNHQRVRIVGDDLAASQVKFLVGQLDGVVGARMHLLIATLGSGVPAFGLNYKDKMEGLFEHFNLDSTYHIDAADVLEEEKFYAATLLFIGRIADARQFVEQRLPRVRQQAAMNFELLN